MNIRSILAAAVPGLPLALVMTSVPAAGPDLSPGVSLALAEHRARTISDLRYEVAFTIPAAPDQPIRGRERVRFLLSDATSPLVFDFRQPPDRVLGVRVGDAPTAYETINGHIVIPAASLRSGENVVEIEFVAGDESLNRNRDFLYTLFVPDRAALALPLFDQPNLKARWRLTLDVPAAWQAVANGALERREERAGRAVHTFAETRPISTYLFAFAAGDFRVETAMRGGRELRMFHRETDAEKVARNRDAIFDLHHTALDWLEEYTGIPYPFGKFDFVLIPSFQFGGMEHPGAILYNASSLMLEESATQNQKLGRASVIAHETAHMWFGDLVTMNWFDDVWTKEVFANFMAAKIVNPSFPEVDHELRFLLAHYPAAYEVDRTAGANPIRQELENLNEAGSLYGAIIYQKAPIVMNHLERLTGAATFREGLREYLRTFSFANATWPDLIEILDRRSPEDLRAWSRVWVEEPGRPTVETSVELEDGRIASLGIRQSDPWGRGRTWTQSLQVLLVGPDTVRRVPVRLDAPEVRVADAIGLPAPEIVLANGDGTGYGLFLLDPESRDVLVARLPTIPDPRVRGTAWITLWDEMLEGRIPAATLVTLAARGLRAETDELNVQRIAGYLTGAYWRFLGPAERLRRAPELEALLWRLMERAETSSRKATYFNAYRSIALTDSAVADLRRVWRRERTIPGLTLAETDEIALAQALAIREVAGWDEILRVQQERIVNPDRKERFAFVAPALSADPAVRDAFFEGLKELRNRQREAWVLEAVSLLNHPLRADRAERYIRPSLELLEEIQRTGDIFFPKRWLDATLGGHRSPAAADAVRRFLDDRPDLPPRLRGKLLQSADELFRAAALAGRSAS